MPKTLERWLIGVVIGTGVVLWPAAESAAQVLDNDTCIGCHGNEGFSIPGADGKPRNLHVIPDKFGKSVHGKRLCVECHKNITAIPHQPGTEVRVSCVECHESQWKSAQLEGRAKEAHAPAELYRETELVLRTVRDFFAPEITSVVVDDRGVFERLREFFDHVMPRFRERLEFYDGATPLFHKHEIEPQIDQLSSRIVPLPSGGSIVVEPTEGMTSIDVNSGRMVRESNPEDLALKTNLEAALEVMRQLRLRDLGGIIVIDFIDVKMEKHRREIETAVRDASKRDRAQMVILPLSQFCLMQIARQKTRPSLQVVSSDPCPACGGTGFVKNLESMGLEIMRALKSTLDRADIALVEARVSPDVAAHLKNRMEDLQKMEERYKKRIHLTPTRELASNRVEFSCYNADGEKVVDFVR